MTASSHNNSKKISGERERESMRTSTYCDHVMSTIIGYNKFEELALLLFLYCRNFEMSFSSLSSRHHSTAQHLKRSPKESFLALLSSSTSYCHRMGGRLLRRCFLEPPDVLETMRRMNASSTPTTVKTSPIIAKTLVK